MTRYFLWSLFLCVGLWTVRNVRVGRKAPKTPREVLRESALAKLTPAYRIRFTGDAERHRLQRLP